MTILKLLIYPNKKLRLKSKPIYEINKNIKKIIHDMFETMYYNKGIGLSAIQVNINLQIITININKEIVLINPKIIKVSKKYIFSEEGCLSIPNKFFNILRYKYILVKYLNINNKYENLKTNSILSICIQHEIDHLKGILIVDYINKK